MVSLDDIAAELPNRRIWRTCPTDWTSYAAASCPVDLLGPIRNAAAYETPLVVAAIPGEIVCAPARSGPLPRTAARAPTHTSPALVRE